MRSVPRLVSSWLCFGAVAFLLGVGGCGRGCGAKKEEAQPAPPGTEPITIARPPVKARPPAFETTAPTGLRRFRAPLGQEIRSVSASADGARLVAVSSRALYLFDPTLARAQVIELPGLLTAPLGAALSAERVAVVTKAPTPNPEGRLYLLDVSAGKLVAESSLGGAPRKALGLPGGRLGVLLAEPPGFLLFDGQTGRRLADLPLPSEPLDVTLTPDGASAIITAASAVVLVDLAAEQPKARPLALGPGRVGPVAAVPVGDAVLVAARVDSGVAALVVPKGGGAPRRLPIGAGPVLGAASSADGSRVAVFTEDPAATSGHRTYVFDTSTWASLGAIDGGPAGRQASAVAHGSKVLVLRCHEVVELDLTALTHRIVQKLPAPSEGPPCLSDLVGLKGFAAVRDVSSLAAWPLK